MRSGGILIDNILLMLLQNFFELDLGLRLITMSSQIVAPKKLNYKSQASAVLLRTLLQDDALYDEMTKNDRILVRKMSQILFKKRITNSLWKSFFFSVPSRNFSNLRFWSEVKYCCQLSSIPKHRTKFFNFITKHTKALKRLHADEFSSQIFHGLKVQQKNWQIFFKHFHYS